MDCEEARKLLLPFIDDELDARSSYEVDEHLARCPDCLAEAESVRASDALVREAARAVADEGVDLAALRGRLGAALDREIAGESRRLAPRPRLRWAVRGLLAASVAAVAALLTIGLSAGPASADFLRDHVFCLQMRGDWEMEAQALHWLCAEGAGPRPVIPALDAAGLPDRKGALCEVAKTRYVHIVYSGEGREPVSLFLGRRLGGLGGFARGERAERVGPYAVVRLRGPGGVEYVLVARSSAGDAEAIRGLIRSQLASSR